MERAVCRISSAIERSERIGIFGDYDCDGITATAELVRFFRRRGVEPLVRLPSREEGYGLQRATVEDFLAQGARLLVTLDTGITAVEEVRDAQEGGMDVIVLDHHQPLAELPPAFAIIHPSLAPGYGEPHPSAAGVALALLRGLEGEHWEDMQTDIALAAIGTIADLVPLRGENRALAQAGLIHLSKLQGPLGLLRQNAGLAGAVTSADVAFRIAPRLNAAGRMADPALALCALLEGGAALEALEELNTRRQRETEALLQAMLSDLGIDDADPSSAAGPLLSAAHEEYPPGIIGLLAGRLTEAFGKPSLVAAIAGETCTASLRSPPCYHITQGLARCSDLLLRFGGHAQAAGCTFPRAALPELTERLAADIAARTKPDELLPSVSIDAVMQPSDISLLFCEQLARLEPFGMGNPEPLLLLPHVQLQSPRRVGSDGKHLQARMGAAKAIGFRLGHLLEHAQGPLDIVCHCSIDTWQGARSAQLVIEDLRASKDQGKTAHITQAPRPLPSETPPSPAR